jgi:excisionase family DNA binding protein
LGAAEDWPVIRACVGAEHRIWIEFVKKAKSLSKEQTMQAFNGGYKKPPARVTIPPEAKLLVSREEAAQLLSLSQRGLDYLIANRRLPIRRIGGRVLIPADLRKYARGDHPEDIVA